MLSRDADQRVCGTGEDTTADKLGKREFLSSRFLKKVLLGVFIDTKLDGDAGANTKEWGEGALPESEEPTFVLEDILCYLEGRLFCSCLCGLDSDLDNVEGLSKEDLSEASDASSNEISHCFVY